MTEIEELIDSIKNNAESFSASLHEYDIGPEIAKEIIKHFKDAKVIHKINFQNTGIGDDEIIAMLKDPYYIDIISLDASDNKGIKMVSIPLDGCNIRSKGKY